MKIKRKNIPIKMVVKFNDSRDQKVRGEARESITDKYPVILFIVSSRSR